MKNSFKFFLSIIFLCVFSNYSKAQSTGAIPSLYLTPSPELNGLGWTGVSFPNEDAFGFYYNPAMLGYFSQTKNIAVQYSRVINWLNLDFMKINNFAFSLGYNFKDLLNGLNLSAGFGFIKNKLDYGKFAITGVESPIPIATYNPYDSYNAFGFGVSVDYYVNLSLGFSYKDIESKSGVHFIRDGQLIIPVINTSAIDYGLLLKVPVIKLIDKGFSWQLSTKESLRPIFNYALGYSRLNIGNEINYVGTFQKDPLPLTARLGHTFTFGLDYLSNKVNFNLLTYNLILEADDILIERPPLTFNPLIDPNPNNFSYQGMLGDIKFGKHLIQLKGDDKVVVHKGHKITFGETVAFLFGSFSGRGYERVVETNGILISSKGMLKLFSAVTNSSILNYIAHHFEFRYISSSVFEDEDFETDITGIELSFGNFSF